MSRLNLTLEQRLCLQEVGSNPHFRSALADFVELMGNQLDWDMHCDRAVLCEKLTQARGLLNAWAVMFLSPPPPGTAQQPVLKPPQPDHDGVGNAAMEAEREKLTCAGCLRPKHQGMVVCWLCFKGGPHPLKYWALDGDGTWQGWLKAMQEVRELAKRFPGAFPA